MAFEYPDAAFVGSLLSHLFLGLYVAVFGLYVSIARKRKTSLGLLDYGLGVLFALAVVCVILDSVQQFFTIMRGGEAPWLAKVNAVTSTLSAILDFISQSLLIYRCWNVWGRKTWIALPPAILALASLATGISVTISLASRPSGISRARKPWWGPLGTTSMAISLVVNAIVSALMIARILFVRAKTAPQDRAHSRLAWIAAVLLESAVVLFVAQLVYLVLYKLGHAAFGLVAGPVTIIYGLNCTAIMVRVGMEAMGTTHFSVTTVVKSSDASTDLDEKKEASVA